MMHRNYRKTQKGFTIVELVVAMVVGSILAGATTLIIVDQARISQLGRDVTLANSYAETTVEGLRSQGFNSVDIGVTDVTNELPDELKAPREGTLEISDALNGIKQIDLTITYNDQGTQRTYSYRTYIGELGVGQY